MNIFSKGNILSLFAWMLCGVYRAGFAYLDRFTPEFLKEDNPVMGNRLPDGLDHVAGLAMISRSYTLVGDEQVGEKIFICKNYSRMHVVDHLSAVILENPGTILAFNIGDLENVAKYAIGLIVSAGGTIAFTESPSLTVNNLTPIVTSDEASVGQGPDIFATITSENVLNAGAKLRFKIVAQVVA